MSRPAVITMPVRCGPHYVETAVDVPPEITQRLVTIVFMTKHWLDDPNYHLMRQRGNWTATIRDEFEQLANRWPVASPLELRIMRLHGPTFHMTPKAIAAHVNQTVDDVHAILKRQRDAERAALVQTLNAQRQADGAELALATQ